MYVLGKKVCHPPALARVVPPARPSGTPAMVAWYAVFVSDDGTEVDIPEELVADCSPVLRRLLAKSCLSMFDSTEQRFREDCGIHELRCFKLVLQECARAIRRRTTAGKSHRRPFEGVNHLMHIFASALPLLRKYECKEVASVGMQSVAKESFPSLALEEFEGSDGKIGISLASNPLALYLTQQNIDFVLLVQELFDPQMLTPEMKQLLAFSLSQQPETIACAATVYLLRGRPVTLPPKAVHALWDAKQDPGNDSFTARLNLQRATSPTSRRKTASQSVLEALEVSQDGAAAFQSTELEPKVHLSIAASLDNSSHGAPPVPPSVAPSLAPSIAQSMDNSAHGAPQPTGQSLPLASSVSQSMDSSAHGGSCFSLGSQSAGQASVREKPLVDDYGMVAKSIVLRAYRITGDTFVHLIKQSLVGFTYNQGQQDMDLARLKSGAVSAEPLM